MPVAAMRHDETAVIDALRRLEVLDTGPEAEFDALVRAAAAVCGVPISVISLIDTERQWFKAAIGLPGVSETPRDVAFCAHAVLGDGHFEVADASQDPRFADNPLVTGPPNIRFYAGAPVRLKHGERIGTICVIDRKPRQLDATQREVLSCLAEATARALEGRQALRQSVALALRAAQADLVLEHSADAIIGVTVDGQVLRWNPAAERLFGYPALDMLGQPVERLAPADRQHEARDAFSRVAGAQAVNYETIRIRRDGAALNVSITAVPDLDPSGTLVGATKFIRDITAQVANARRLAKSEERARLYESTPAMLHSIDPQGRLVAVSDQWLSKLDYRRDEVIGRLSTDFLTPESREIARSQVLPRLFATGRADNVEYQIVTQRGELLDVLFSACVECDDHGAVVRTLSVLEDVTVRRRAERALLDEKQQLANILEGTRAGTWAYWPATGAFAANDTFRTMLGFNRDDASPTSREDFSERVHLLDRQAVSDSLEALVAGATTSFEAEFRMRRGDGSWVWVLSRANALARNGQGRALKIAGIQMDISHRVALSNAADASRRDLQTVLDALPSSVGYWDAKLVNRFANVACHRWFGAAPATIPGTHLREMLGDELFERSRPLMEAALRGEPQTFERSIPTAEGQGVRDTIMHYLPDESGGEVRGFYVLVHDVSELKLTRRRAQVAARQSQALLSMVQDLAIYSVTDRAGRIIDANDAFCRISGYTHDELVGQTHRVVNSATQGAQFWIDIWSTIAAGNSWRGEVCNRAKDGSLYWVDTMITPFVGEAGRIENYISVRFDITAAKSQAQQLAFNEARYRALIEDQTDLISLATPDGRLSFVNDAYAWHFGRAASTLIGTSLFANVAPHEREAVVAHWEALCGSDVPIDNEYSLVAANGACRWFSWKNRAIRDAGGTVTAVHSVGRDITDRKNVEQAMQRTSALLHAVLDAATEVSIVAVDLGGTISLFNTGAERLLGYDRSEVVGLKSSITFHDRDELRERAHSMSTELGRPVRTGTVLVDPAMLGQPREWSYRRKDNSQVRVTLTVTAMRDADGQCFGYLGVAHDISMQKEHEQSLQLAADAAQRANLAKSQFLANMSHEIRTPLNAVIGIGHLLAGTGLDDDQRQLLAKSQVAGRSLLGIVNDVLDLAKIESGELTLDDAPFQPRLLLRDVDALFRSQADEKGLTLELSCVGDVPPWLVGDAQLVRQILVNLVGNAVKFTAQGGVRVTLQVLDRGASLVRVRCSVRDTGIGISADAQQRLFQAFSQADASTTRRYGGTGLGLSIVRQLAHAMGGEVGMCSQPGQGSEFWATLSLALPTAAQANPASADGATLEVLVVDDHLADRQSLAAHSRALGWRAVELDSGAAAIALIEARRASGADLPDALIVDQKMPDMTGLQAVEHLAALLGRENLPAILFVSAHDRSQIAELDAQRLASDTICKPVGILELFNAVNDGVARRTGSTSKVTQSTRVGAVQARWLPGMRVLVVDDADINRDVARRLLEREGAQVQTCNSGREAVDCLRARPDAFDVVLMDVQMPEMDGIEATRLLRGELGLTLPVVALTAGALVEERRRAMAAGMTDFLTKPLDPQTLVSALRCAVEARLGIALSVQPAASKPEDAAAWPAVDGIDAADAALRTGGDAGLFLSILGSLPREFGDLARLHLAVPADAPGRAALAARFHKLRGGLGTLGARKAHQMAGKAEQALTLSGHDAGPAVADLGAALRTLFDAAATVLNMRGAEPAVTAKLASQGPGVTALTAGEREEFIGLVRRQEMVALDRFEMFAPALRELLDQQQLQQVRSALDDLNFAAALALLDPVAA